MVPQDRNKEISSKQSRPHQVKRQTGARGPSAAEQHVCAAPKGSAREWRVRRRVPPAALPPAPPARGAACAPGCSVARPWCSWARCNLVRQGPRQECCRRASSVGGSFQAPSAPRTQGSTLAEVPSTSGT